MTDVTRNGDPFGGRQRSDRQRREIYIDSQRSTAERERERSETFIVNTSRLSGGYKLRYSSLMGLSSKHIHQEVER
jgi:hypothetical protein